VRKQAPILLRMGAQFDSSHKEDENDRQVRPTVALPPIPLVDGSWRGGVHCLWSGGYQGVMAVRRSVPNKVTPNSVERV